MASTSTSPVSHVPIPRRGVDYRGKVVLAPMVRSGELPCRLLALKYGADLVWGPETIDQAMIGTTRRVNERAGTIDFTRPPSHPKQGKTTESVIYRLHPELERDRLVFQMGTAKPEYAVAAGKLVAPDVAGIDVNAGCPKPFSTKGGMGAALLQEPERLASILEALVTEVGNPHEIGISVKIRLLETPERTAALVSRLVRTGITGLTVHCRTTPMRPREPAIREQLRMIGDVCRGAGVACLMNGDVSDRAQALALAAEYGVDGAMIATAAESNPSVFQPEGVLSWEEITREYLTIALRMENKWNNTKFTLAQLVPGKTDTGREMQHTRNYSQTVRVLKLPEFAERAAEVDAALGFANRPDNVVERAAKHNARKAPSVQEKAPSVDRPAKKARHGDPMPSPLEQRTNVSAMSV